MTRVRILAVVCFVLAFAAGLVAGLSLRPAAAARESRSSWLVRELRLSGEQRKQMEKIWATLHESGHDYGERRREIARRRDEAIRGLIPDEKRGELDRVSAEFARKIEALSAERRKAFAQAVERTKQILDPEQRSKYEEILARWNEGRRGPERNAGGPPPGPRRDGTRPPANAGSQAQRQTHPDDPR